MKSSFKGKFLSKNVFILITVFLLSGIHLYGDILPFGISAIASFGTSPLNLLFYTVGIITSRAGYFSFLRHAFTPFIYLLFMKLLKGKVPPFILSGISVLLGGTLSLIILREHRILYFSFVITEAIVSSVFTLIFAEAKKSLREKMSGGGVDEVGFSFFIVSLMTLCLSFSEIEVGRFSLSSALMLAIGMASSYKHKAPVSVVVNMAAGFFSFFFTPGNLGAVAYFALSGFFASLFKKQGKFLIPFTYIFLLPFFPGVNILNETFSMYDLVASSLVFLFLPRKVLDFIDIIPNVQSREASCLRLSERVNSVADTFSSISDIFAKSDLLGEDFLIEDAAGETVKAVCTDCPAKGKCSKEAKEALKKVSENIGSFRTEDIKCIRKKELFSAFSGNYRVMRMENMWQSHIKEESLALSCQMMGISKMLKGLSKKEELKILRDETKEREILLALKKRGIAPEKISAGINRKGVFEVNIKMVPCKGKGLCDDVIPSVIKEVTGCDVMRFGVKNCTDCRVSFAETPKYSLDVSVSEIPKEEESGDSLAFAYVDDEHFAVALSDGMGTGKKAREKSSVAVKLALRLLALGMDLPSSVNMVNSLLLRQGGRDFATLDIALLNLETGRVLYTKNAAAPSFILTCGGKVKKLSLEGTPLGIVGSAKSEVGTYTLKDGDFLIMVSDGVCDSFKNKGEDELYKIIENFTGGNSNDLAEYIMLKAGSFLKNDIKDDMTAITVGCIKKQKCGNTKEKRRLTICEATGR